MDVFTRGGLVTARHLIVARRMLESEAAALAATNHNAEDSTRMTEVLTAFDATPEADPGKGARLDVAFHESIALASGNPVIQIMFGSIRVLTHGLVLRSLTDRYVRNEAAPLHRVILEAILAHDVPAARSSMEEHLVIAERHYGGDLDRPLTETLEQRAATLPRLADLLHEASLHIKARDEVAG
jgi:GntR family transcriptional repressor for pyruvate dehydrogenase complex